MDIKTEIDEVVFASTTYKTCRLCLSIDRRTKAVGRVVAAFNWLTDCEPAEDVLVCWECHRRLENVIQFKIQAIKTRLILESSDGRMISDCWSRLASCTKTFYDLTLHAPELVSENEIKEEVDDTYFDVFTEPVETESKSPDTSLAVEYQPLPLAPPDKKELKKIKKAIKAKKKEQRKEEKKEGKIKEKEKKDSKGLLEKHVSKVKVKSPKKVKEKLNIQKEVVNPGPYECDLCHIVYKGRHGFIQHLKRHNPKFQCEHCGKRLATRRVLNVHYLSHAPIEARPWECDICHRRFITKGKLGAHKLLHDGVKRFQCDICPNTFWLQAELNRHKKIRHGATDVCATRAKFTRTKSLVQNDRLYIDKNTGLPVEKIKVETVRDSVKKIYKCDQCDAMLKGYTSLYAHMKIHSGIRAYQCNVCGKKFVTKTSLNSHTVVHTDARPYKCDVCDATFKFASGLWGHKVMHTGVKPHECTICGAKFTLKGNLTGHMRMHSNEKPFECDICGQRFPLRRNLRNHLRVHSKQ